jgi:hypothetical protein
LKPVNTEGAQNAQSKVADAPWGLQSPPLVMMMMIKPPYIKGCTLYEKITIFLDRF